MRVSQKTECVLEDIGLMDYASSYSLQRRYVQEIITKKAKQRILFCEHPPILTLGRSGHEEHILFPREEILKSGAQIVNIDRGGDITLHCPGQLVVYPLLDLNHHGKDLHRYLHDLEQVGIDLLNDFGIMAHRLVGKTGVYVDQKKILSIGVGVKKWISFHGLALNVNCDLKLFSWIKPCGLDVKVTSMKDILKKDVSVSDVKPFLKKHLENIFNLELHEGKSNE
jgi:lipoate-protein ligase B